MPDRIFCVDFGAAFTKVALRTAPQENCALIPYPGTGYDLWAPTVVAADWKNGSTKPELYFGEEAADRAEGPYNGGRIVVYSNFKRDLFSTVTADKPTLHPLEELLQSSEFDALANRYSVQP